jgi:hypothetical protein
MALPGRSRVGHGDALDSDQDPSITLNPSEESRVEAIAVLAPIRDVA